MSDVFVMIPLTIPGFQHGQQPIDSSKDRFATEPLEVGLKKIKARNPSEPPKWGLVFLLERARDPTHAIHLKAVSPALLLGRVLEGSDSDSQVIFNLSRAGVPERLAYSFSLEAK